MSAVKLVDVPVVVAEDANARASPLRIMLAAATGCVAAAALLQQARPGVDPVPPLAVALMNMTRARIPVRRRESFGVHYATPSVLAYLLQAPCNVRSLVMMVTTVSEVEQLGATLCVLRPDHFQVRHIRLKCRIRTAEPDALLRQLLTRPFGGLRCVRHLELLLDSGACPAGAIDGSALFAHAAQLRRLELSGDVAHGFCGAVDWTPMGSLRAIGTRSTITAHNAPRTVGRASALTRFTMPDSVRTLEPEFLTCCRALSSVHFSAALRACPDGLCTACPALTAIDLRHCHSLTRLGNSFARGCKLLVSVLLPDSVATVGRCLLSYCGRLERFAMPAALTALGPQAFQMAGVRRIDFSRCRCAALVDGAVRGRVAVPRRPRAGVPSRAARRGLARHVGRRRT
jgi:hypothetical protein